VDVFVFYFFQSIFFNDAVVVPDNDDFAVDGAFDVCDFEGLHVTYVVKVFDSFVGFDDGQGVAINGMFLRIVNVVFECWRKQSFILANEKIYVVIVVVVVFFFVGVAFFVTNFKGT
jgi:hypothetical protein